MKIYLDATPEERARRRFAENQEKGIETSYEEVLNNILMRDENDKNKEIGSLVKLPDAIYIDTTDPDIEKNAEKIKEVINQKLQELESKKKQDDIEKKTKSNEEKKKGQKKKKEPKTKSKDTKGKMIMRKIVKGFLYFLYRMIYRLEKVGEENIPKEGAYIICGNHVHALDAPAVVVSCKRHINFIVKAELFNNPILAYLGRTFNVIPIKRGKQDIEAMKRSLKVLSNQELLGLFPEGTRKGLAKGKDVKNGAAFMAARTGTPVIPVGIQGTFKPFTKVTLNFGKPIDFSKYQSKTPEKEDLAIISKTIMDHIIMLTNEQV